MIQPIMPMLATKAQTFDSDEYFFEVKWDGVRALASVEQGHVQLWGRGLADYAGRYPELDVLRSLPSGTVVDGEVVVFRNHRPDLSAVLRRHQMVNAMRIRQACRHTPAQYVVFDLLYHHGRSLLPEPYSRRRLILADLLTKRNVPELVLSDGIAEFGRLFFEQAVAQGHEGIMAKHQSSRYLPGQRCASWRKIKPTQTLPCVIIGYIPSSEGLRSLLVANAHEGSLRYVGQVTSGMSYQTKTDLVRRLAQFHRDRPVVACSRKAVWVEPELFCHVRFLQWTQLGCLRGASFGGLIEAV